MHLIFITNAPLREIDVKFIYEPSAALAQANWRYSNGKAIYPALEINMSYYNVISPNNKNGLAPYSSAYLDGVVAHELTHAVIAATIDHMNLLPEFIIERLPDLVHGIDDERGYDIQNLCSASGKLSAFLDLNNKSYTLGSPLYVAGYMALRYLVESNNLLNMIDFSPTSTVYYFSSRQDSLIMTSPEAIEIWLDVRNGLCYNKLNL